MTETVGAAGWMMPEWTALGDPPRPPRAMYPLGIDATTQTLERRLFDGITSQTPHVGYYAFYAWALTRYRQWVLARQGSTTGVAEFRRGEKRFVARLEAVLRAATLIRDTATPGMFGSRAALADGVLDESERLALPDNPPYRTTGVNFYVGPLMALRCGSRSEGSTGDFRAGAGAEALADALEESASVGNGEAALGRVLKAAGGDAKTLAGKEVYLVEPVLALGAVRRPPLRRALIATLFAHEGPTRAKPGSLSWSRSQALAFCLEVASRAAGTVEALPVEIVRRVILTQYLAEGQRFELPPEYVRTHRALRRLYERHLLQLALYGLWREVVQHLGHRTVGLRILKDEITQAVVRLASERTVRDWLGADPLDQSVGEAVDRCRRARVHRLKQRPWQSGLESLAEDVARGASTTADSVAAPSLALLLGVCEEWLARTAVGRSVMFADWHDEGARDRLALSVVCCDLQARSQMSLGSYLDWVLDAYVIGQSLRATVGKGPQSRTGEYVYFIVPDSGGYRVNHAAPVRAYLRIDSLRLRLALQMLEQLGLVESDPGLRVTTRGASLLAKLRAHHGHHTKRVLAAKSPT